MIELDISTGVRARGLQLGDRLQAPDGGIVEVDELTLKHGGVHAYCWPVPRTASGRRQRLAFNPDEVVTVVPGGESLTELFGALHACVATAERAFDEAQAEAYEDADVREAAPWQLGGPDTVHLRAGDRTWAIGLIEVPGPEFADPPGGVDPDGPQPTEEAAEG